MQGGMIDAIATTKITNTCLNQWKVVVFSIPFITNTLPLIGGEKLSTPSGTSFNVNLSCPTSNAFLQVMAHSCT
jgi:hypothetical protein